MTERDSRDAWAGIVEFDEQDSPAQASDTGGLSASLQNADITTDVDAIPPRPSAELERMQTQDHTVVNRASSAPNKPLSLRAQPIQEKRRATTEPGPTPSSAVAPSLPEVEPNSVSSFDSHRSLTDLEEAPPKQWDPKINATWADYRQVIIITCVGLLAVVLIVIFQSVNRPSTDDPKAILREPSPPPATRLERRKAARAGQITPTPSPSSDDVAEAESMKPSAAPGSEPTEAVAEKVPAKVSAEAGTAPAEKPTIQKQTIPMLSILSVPSGALVEIGGRTYGKTPVIRMSPKTSGPLKIKLRLSDHRTEEVMIRPNKDGHYEVQLTLEPLD